MGSILTKLSTTPQITTSDCLEVHNLFSHLEFSCDNCKEIYKTVNCYNICEQCKGKRDYQHLLVKADNNVLEKYVRMMRICRER
jgi:Zn finger protein HypA/HybF involved in hydrogenase expression